MTEDVVARIDLVFSQGIEHERIVRVGAVADPDELLGIRHGELPDALILQACYVGE